MKRADLTGKTFGRLTVIGKADPDQWGHARWLCSCICGSQPPVVILQNQLLRRKTQSCGCLQKELLSRRMQTHGFSGVHKTPEYEAWRGAIGRCRYPKNKGYKNYGGRGIIVCDRWAHSYEAFFKDMEPKPSSEHSLDRIDVNGNYEPSNCRWATRKEQNNNQRKRRIITEFSNEEILAEAKKRGLL